MIASLILVMMIECFADEYGQKPYQTISTWANGYSTYQVPSTYTSGNAYTFYINLASQELDSVYNSYHLYQKTAQNTTIELYIEHSGTQVIMISDNTNMSYYEVSVGTGILLIPYYRSTDLEYVLENVTPNTMQILNNQQLYTMNHNGYAQGQEAGVQQGYNLGLQNGYSTGYTAGETAGYESGYNQGYYDGEEEGQSAGYNVGYQAGYTEGEENATEIGEGGAKLITAVVEAPVNVFTKMLNFEILGVNVLGFVTACLSICLVFAIIKRVL